MMDGPGAGGGGRPGGRVGGQISDCFTFRAPQAARLATFSQGFHRQLRFLVTFCEPLNLKDSIGTAHTRCQKQGSMERPEERFAR